MAAPESDQSPGSSGVQSSGVQLAFLPPNQAHSPTEAKRRRTWVSCDGCRKRKCRCEPHQGRPQPCRRCVREMRDCQMRSTRPVRLKNPTLIPNIIPDGQHPGPPTPRPPPEREGPLSNESFQGPDSVAVTSEAYSPTSVRSRIIASDVHNTTDALELLTRAANDEEDRVQNPMDVAFLPPTHHPRQPGDETFDPIHSTLSESTLNAVWDRFLPIRKGILAKHEVQEYLSFYFTTLWPLKPVIPRLYREQVNHPLLIDREPVLTITLLVLAARYHRLSGQHGEIRSERIHWKLWRYLQTYLNTVLWGSNCTRSLGMIASILLLIEWHSKAINNPAELCEDLEEGVTRQPQSALHGAKQATNVPSTGQHSYEDANALEKLNILSAAHRSNKISWTLLSVAISLAHEGRCFENSLQATPLTCSEVERVDHAWSKLLCVFLFLSDENLALRLGREPLLSDSARQTVMGQLSASFASCLDDSFIWESTFELYVELGKVRKLVHAMAANERGGESKPLNILPTLEHIQRNLARWRRQHKSGIEEPKSPLHHWLDIEYRYALLYSFSPALATLRRHEANLEQPDQVPEGNTRYYSQFAHVTKQASQDLLSIVVYSLEPLKLLQYAPVRFWLYIIPASLHLIKTSLALPTRPGEVQENAKLLHAVVEATRRGSPDDIHLAMSFSSRLEALLRVTLDVCPGDMSTAMVQNGGAMEALVSSAQTGQLEEGNPNLVMMSQIQAWDNVDFGMLDFQGNFEAWNSGSDLMWTDP